ncbi:MAG: hypothetical protein P1V35_06705 [Planctomycetota bacterium]|nr:hypothetical protein [Planctomycetota bacterium]
MDTVALIKYTVLLIGIPIWLPFMRELWLEFNLAMREDGGLWGQTPTPRERQRIVDGIAREPLRQVHLPKGHLGIRRKSAAQGPLPSGPQAGGPRKRSFGSR